MTAEAEKLNVTQDWLEDPYKWRLEEIVKQINELNDGENTNNDKIENMSWVLTTEFSKRLSPETAKKLLEWISSFTEGQTMPGWLQDLINFLEPIANNFSKSIEWNLTDDEWTFKSKIDQKNWNNESELDKFKKTREDMEKKLFPDWQDIIDERLINIKGTIDKIKKIIERPNETNTKFLQKFIYENLDEDNKIKFAQKNCIGKIYNNDNFDWKFWISTLTYLDNVLQKIETYVKDVKESIAVEEKNKPSEWTEELLKNVKVKESIILPEWDTSISAADLLESLPDGATAEFKDNNWIDKSKTDEQEVTVVVKSWDKIKEITIIATVDTTSKKVGLKIKETWNPTTPTAPATPEATKPTAPEKIKVNGKEHSIAIEPPANKFNWWTLYYVNNWENPEALNNTLDENKDREYLMQVNNETYKVKLDQNWNLKPLAVNYESNAKVLLKNNPSCIAYLQNKIGNLPGNPQIAWNSNMEDYVIRSYNKWLTIEPMILDWKWVSENLSQCLAFENFANFLRGAWGINDLKFKNDNPDLKLKDGKLFVRIKKWTRLDGDSKSGKWYEVNLQKFWISDNDAFNKFKKYNNGEDWKDKWDKKKDNKGYTKIDFPNVSGPADTPTTTETPTTTTTTETPTTTTTTTTTTETPTTTTTTETPTTTTTTETPTTTTTTETPTTTTTTETPLDNNIFTMSVSDFQTMQNTLWDKKFIEKSGDGKISYNLDKTKTYLEGCRGKARADLKNNVAYIAAVQILLNDKAGDNGEKVNISGNFDDKTKARVKQFQENYNQYNPEWTVDLKVDWYPWKDTLTVLLDEKIWDTILEGKWHINWDGWIVFDDWTRIENENGRNYIEINWERYYEYKSGMDWKWYLYGIENTNNWYLYWYLFIWNFENGKRKWKWTMTWADWDKYEWQWENDKMEWQWTYTWADWSEYKWKLKNGKFVQWTRTWANWDIYVWEWENDNMKWEWTMTYADWSEYKWEWKNGKREWIWSITWADWGKYVWEWKNNERGWEWIYTWANWNTYEWSYNDGTGTEKFTLKDGTELRVKLDENKNLINVVSEWEHKGKYINVGTWEFVDNT